jgi:hypothetical protein
VGVDGIGLGAGTVNKLRGDLSFPCVDIQSGTSAVEQYEGGLQMEEKFKNLRAQMWWQMRVDLQFGEIVLPNDPDLFADLCAPKWSATDKVIVVEPKEQIKKRLKRSPNKGDAAVMWNWVRKQRVTEAAVGIPKKKEEGKGKEITPDPFKAKQRRLL